MKRTFLFLLLLISCIGAHAGMVGQRIYVRFKIPQFTSSSREIELSIDGKHVGHVGLHNLLEIKLAGHKKYEITFFDKGNNVATLHIDTLRDSLSYYVFDITASDKAIKGSLHKEDAVSGGIYVMQHNNYSGHYVAYEEGLDQDGGSSSRDNTAYGSGFLISADGYIVTNYHVVDGSKVFKVKGVEGDFTKEYEAEIVAKDVNNDLVLLQLKDKTVKLTAPPYMLRTVGASTGEDIFVLGYPLGPALGDEIKLTTGVISAKSGVGGNVSSYQISAAAQPGNSGGPLFDTDGNILGVVNAKIKNAENITYAVKAVYLQALMGMLANEPKMQAANTLKDKKLTEKVSAVSKYIYIIKCE